MRIPKATQLLVISTLALIFAILLQPLLGTSVARAQGGADAVDTPTAEPPPPTNTSVPAATATNTPVPAATATSGPTPAATNTPAPSSSGPVAIPEPITVVLFGTGLAALSAAAAARRKKGD